MNIKDLSIEELDVLIREKGLPKYRTDQLLYWLYKKPVESFDDMTNLPKSLREEFDKNFTLWSIKEIETLISQDKTEKKIFLTKDNDVIESVIIPDKERLTLCISTQIGCRMGCKFCLTGYQGFKRNLSPSEILDQILWAKMQGYPITNIVIMGMGEPLDNYHNVKKALKILFHEKGISFSHRRVTLSTVGIIPEIEDLLKSFPQIVLSLSLNAPDSVKRAKIMPVEKIHPFKSVMNIMRKYQKRRKLFTVEYVMLKDFNDSLEDAVKLIETIRSHKLRCKINLIPFNPWPGSPFERPEEKKILEFQNLLIKNNFSVFIRKSRGSDILAACGQLRWKRLNP